MDFKSHFEIRGMNMAATFGQAISEVDQLIIGQAHELSDKLKQHWLEMFPPVAQKNLRQFQLSEAAHFLGVTSGYLRNLSLESKGPLPQVTPSGRRSYTAEQLQEVRQDIERNLRAAEALARVPLRNADEPDAGFSADLS